MLTDTTPARVGIVADGQLKDRRILLPDPGSAASKLADLAIAISGPARAADASKFSNNRRKYRDSL